MNKQLIEFKKNYLELNLNQQTYESSLIKHKDLYYGIDTFDAISGNTFDYSIKPESPLEKISEVIRLIPHINYVGQGGMVRSGAKKSFNFFDFEKLKELASNLKRMNFRGVNGSQQIEISEEDEQGNPKKGSLQFISQTVKDREHESLLFNPTFKTNHYNRTCSHSLNLHMSSLVSN